ncbi:MAG: hypothetical protein PHX93_01265 [Candidatus Peribacteraceae bacterium]|nr:hypothetical protein [Candidatus Peribacteraceae bacterium]
MLRPMHPDIHMCLHPPVRNDRLPQQSPTPQQQLQTALNRRLALDRAQLAQCIRFEQRNTRPS